MSGEDIEQRLFHLVHTLVCFLGILLFIANLPVTRFTDDSY